ncbi:ester cyclase [Acuticoccus sp. I52.16.1]|uniref:ester cyclase n=1 Tax=Acuticoccus sp. I52.16.1 TaxID=2928472 RepID=UPI001FD09425|nr:ester cyclase [Acuticoccus sp. I52.16.1]UOM34904.1 ester cyclase [Acuticoccus sp. I52.16.1]
MTRDELSRAYRHYIDCLNRRDWDHLGDFVGTDVAYNGATIGLAGYRAMLEGDVRAIPDLHFEIERLTADPPWVASRLQFDCTPVGTLFGLAVNGRRVRFAENIFYEFADGRIRTVWSIIDKDAIARQI